MTHKRYENRTDNNQKQTIEAQANEIERLQGLVKMLGRLPPKHIENLLRRSVESELMKDILS